MNVTVFITMNYENKDTWSGRKNKANSKPIQTQSKPIKANKMPKQTQFKPNSNPIYRGVASGGAGTNPISEAKNAQ